MGQNIDRCTSLRDLMGKILMDVPPVLPIPLENIERKNFDGSLV